MEHSANRLHNLELMDKMNSDVWLHHNSTIQSLTKSIELNAEKVKRKIDDVNVSRRTLQEKEYTKIAKLHNKTYQAIATAWQIKNSL